jgi:hypothetical protein
MSEITKKEILIRLNAWRDYLREGGWSLADEDAYQVIHHHIEKIDTETINEKEK